MSPPVVVTVTAGTLVQLTGTFQSAAGTPEDPTTVTLKFAQGVDGFPVTTWVYGGAGGIERVSAGVYSALVDTTPGPGMWPCEWIGTGSCQVAQPFYVNVTPLLI